MFFRYDLPEERSVVARDVLRKQLYSVAGRIVCSWISPVLVLGPLLHSRQVPSIERFLMIELRAEKHN